MSSHNSWINGPVHFHGYISDTVLVVLQLLIMATVLRAGRAFTLISDI